MSKRIELEGSTATRFWSQGHYLYQIGDDDQLTENDVAKLAADLRRSWGRPAFDSMLDQVDEDYRKSGAE